MRKYLKKIVAIGMAVSLLGSYGGTAAAMEPIMSYSEVEPGAQGTAHTVVDASGEIKQFDVEIIGNVDNDKGSDRMIMAKASGPVVRAAGGVLQGMSGSPIYIDGKLVGALSAGIKDMTPYTFFITPIEDMLPLWQMPDRKNKTRIRSFDYKKYLADRKKAEEEAKKKAAAEAQKTADKAGQVPAIDAATASKIDDELAKIKAKYKQEDQKDKAGSAAESKGDKAQSDQTSPDKKTEAKPAENAGPAEPAADAAKAKAEPKAKLFLSGFNSAGLAFMKKTMDPNGKYEFLPMGGVASGDGSDTDYDASLLPGAAVGVAACYGDFSVGATGTVTAVDGKRILAFGHPFLHRGNVNYFMTDAKIVGTISGQSLGMKVATIGHIIGRISQDRETGIAGTLGDFPSVVPIKVHIKDNSLGRDENFGARIAYDEDFLSQLSGGIAYAAMSRTADDLSASTANLQFTIRTNAVKDGKFVRSNMFYNTADVGQIAVSELMQAMNIICSNTDKESDIIDVQVDVTLNSGRKTATLLSAIPDKSSVKPGDTVNFKTTIKPYRADKQTLMIPFTVPKNQPAGKLALDVRGGSLVPITAMQLLQQTGVAVTAEDTKQLTTEEQLDKLKNTGRSNDIVIAPTPVVLTEQQQAKLAREAAKAARKQAKQPRKVNLLGVNKEKKSGETKFETKYIIDNVIHTSLQIVEK